MALNPATRRLAILVCAGATFLCGGCGGTRLHGSPLSPAILEVIRAIPFDSVCARACGTVVVVPRILGVRPGSASYAHPRSVADLGALREESMQVGRQSVIFRSTGTDRPLGPDTTAVEIFLAGRAEHDRIVIGMEFSGNSVWAIVRATLRRANDRWSGTYEGFILP